MSWTFLFITLHHYTAEINITAIMYSLYDRMYCTFVHEFALILRDVVDRAVLNYNITYYIHASKLTVTPNFSTL